MSLAKILSKSADIRKGKHIPCGRPVIVPLAGFYRRSDESERERLQMYYNLAVVFGFQNWRAGSYNPAPLPEPGRDGQARLMEHYGDSRRGTFRDNNAHPLEYLEGNMKLLRDSAVGHENEQQMMAAHSASSRRARIARTYHETKIGGEASGLKSVDLERVSSTGFGPGSISDHQISCMQMVSRWEAAMPQAVRLTMHKTLYEGLFAFMPLGTADSDLCLLQIRMGLDIISEIEGEMSERDLLAAWPGLKRFRPVSRPDVGWADR